MRIVAHLDMDGFYAAIEERDAPQWRGLPLVVGADPRGGSGRGVVLTANYPARSYGVHSAMPIATAWRCSERAKREGRPPVIFLPADMAKYRRVSGYIMALLGDLAPVVEQASIDEAYLDLTPTGSFEAATTLCRRIKDRIAAEERLTASVGLAPNKLVAKIASGIQKPDGLTVVTDEEAETFLAPLPLRVIPGIGPKTEAEFVRQGMSLIQDLKRFSKEELTAMLGRRGADLFDKVRGRDEAPISAEADIKSIGEQETFAQDSREAGMLTDRLMAMCEGVMVRVEAEGVSHFRTVVLTVRFADFQTVSRRRTLVQPSGELRTLQGEAIKLFLPFLDRRANADMKLIRLLGVRVEHLTKKGEMASSEPIQPSLWH